LAEIDAVIREYWEEISKRPDDVPAWAEQILLDALPEMPEWVAGEITEKHVRDAVAAAKGSKGPDGWAEEEVKAAIEMLAKDVADFYNTMEVAGCVPTAWQPGDVTLVPKTEEVGDQGNLRPITVMALLYRLWTSLRLRVTLFDWEEAYLQRLGANLKGCRREASAKELTWGLGIYAEKAMWEGKPVMAVLYDLIKAFNSLPRELVWAMVRKLGFPETILAVVQDLHEHLRQRYKFGGFLGEVSRMVNGFIQGDTLSMLFANVVTAAWHAMAKGTW